MAEARVWPRQEAVPPSASALVLVQAAAARAEIGPFAVKGRATPQSAAGCYRATAQLMARSRPARIRN